MYWQHGVWEAIFKLFGDFLCQWDMFLGQHGNLRLDLLNFSLTKITLGMINTNKLLLLLSSPAARAHLTSEAYIHEPQSHCWYRTPCTTLISCSCWSLLTLVHQLYPVSLSLQGFRRFIAYREWRCGDRATLKEFRNRLRSEGQKPLWVK